MGYMGILVSYTQRHILFTLLKGDYIPFTVSLAPGAVPSGEVAKEVLSEQRAVQGIMEP